MPELPPLTPGDFTAYFIAVNGHPPFPWQSRLAAHLGAGGAWPAVLDLPTGSGKTAVIDIAIFQLAVEAGRETRTSPLRVVYVVDRRTIVDQAHDRAERLRAAIETASVEVLATVHARLASYGRDGAPLLTAVLRGGIARSDLWARSPDQPLIAVSTVDQVGSRLLFRGYGVSDSMRPVHAGLLGNDVLYLLDEVHLSQPFRETLTAIAGRYRGWAEKPLTSPFVVVEMSATPGRSSEGVFHLEADDERDEVLARRLRARKMTTLASAGARAFLAEVEKHVTPLAANEGATVAVVVNRVASARLLYERLSTALEGASVHLLTGRMRPLDRDNVEQALFPRLRAGRKRNIDKLRTVVVATQCIEAGADFDFDALVTECASIDALRQRFGRLDRLGELGESRGVVVARTDTLKDDPVYGDALGATWTWLCELATAGGGTVDFGIRGMALPGDAIDRGLLAPKAHAPVLLPSHLDSWVQTSPRPEPDPDVALWLHGPERGVADIQVVWRADLAAETLLRANSVDESGRRALDAAIGTIEAIPPASGEAMSVPFSAVRRWLDGRSERNTADVEGMRDEAAADDSEDRPRAARPALAWRGDASEVIDAQGLRPGDTIVVPASYGGIAFGTWAPDVTNPVVDLAEFAVLRQRGRAMLRIHVDVIRTMFGSVALPVPVPQPADSEAIDDRGVVRSWLESIPSAGLNRPVAELLNALLARSSRGILVERLPVSEQEGSGEYFLVSRQRRVGFSGSDVTTEDDRASFTGCRVSLEEHLGGVRDLAGEFADRIGVATDIAADLRLAGRWHDVGKLDSRFQRLLQGGSAFKSLIQREPLAKSAVTMNDRRQRESAERRSGYPRGTRHEVMSTALMTAAEKELKPRAGDWELVLHLVATHHGRCRPLAPWVPDEQPVEMAWELDGVTVAGSSAHGLARLDSGVAERFWRLVRRYGWWGLAWTEAILRLGDHRRSEWEQQQRSE